jgi:hypothetical protein
MTRITITRSDFYPSGTVIGVWPRHAQKHGADPTGPPIASAVMELDESLVPPFRAVLNDGGVENPGDTTPYVAHAVVDGEHRYLQVSPDR